jgi:hypothetical protein
MMPAPGFNLPGPGLAGHRCGRDPQGKNLAGNKPDRVPGRGAGGARQRGTENSSECFDLLNNG